LLFVLFTGHLSGHIKEGGLGGACVTYGVLDKCTQGFDEETEINKSECKVNNDENGGGGVVSGLYSFGPEYGQVAGSFRNIRVP
jgi:hypothetical protein